MKTASISEAKNRLSAYIDLVRRGETVQITDRGNPVARLVPLEAGTKEFRESWLRREGGRGGDPGGMLLRDCPTGENGRTRRTGRGTCPFDTRIAVRSQV